MKKIGILCVVLAAMTITACGADNETADTTTAKETATTQQETTAEKEAEYETLEKKDIKSVGELDSSYENDTYKINLFTGWKHEESNGADLLTFEDKEVRIGITSGELGEGGTLEDCIENLCTLYNSVDNYNVTGVGELTLNGLEGGIIRYEIVAEDFSYTGYQIIVEGVENMYVITFVANTEIYDEYESKADDIISTFVEK